MPDSDIFANVSFLVLSYVTVLKLRANVIRSTRALIKEKEKMHGRPQFEITFVWKSITQFFEGLPTVMILHPLGP